MSRILFVLCALLIFHVHKGSSFNRLPISRVIHNSNLRVKESRISFPALKATADAKEISSLIGNSNTDKKERKRRLPTWASPHGEDGELVRETIAGLVVALATIPTSVAYSTVIGLAPTVGVWSSVLVGLVVAVVGGAPGLIAGAAGVVALPIAKLVASHGYKYMGCAVILAAAMEIVFGLLKQGDLADAVEEPVVVGFLNAFAVFLFVNQLRIFRSAPGAWLQGPLLNYALLTAASCFSVINIAPKFFPKLPPSLVGLVFSSLLAIIAKFPVKTLADVYGQATFSGGLSALPSIVRPQASFSLETLKIIFPTAFGIFLISTLETLLASRIACDVYRCRVDVYEEANPNKLVVGLGLGNAASALLGGFGGCGLIPNTLLNGKSGGEGYASSFAFAAFLTLSMVVFAPVIGAIPVAALGGLMLNVAFSTMGWKASFELAINALKSLVGLPVSSQNDTGSPTNSNANSNAKASGSVSTMTKKDAIAKRFKPFFDFAALVVTMKVCLNVDMGIGVLAGVSLTKMPEIIGLVFSRLPLFSNALEQKLSSPPQLV